VTDQGDADQERLSLVRAVRQQLESLARAGLDRVPAAHKKSESSAPPAALAGLPSSDVADNTPGAMSKKAEERERIPPARSLPPESAPAQPAAVIPTQSSPLPQPSLSELFQSSELANAPMPVCDRLAALESLAREVAACVRCPHLARTRTQTVFGVGRPDTRLMFVGEAPGADEDRQGEPFVGRAGQLLTDMITKGMGLSRGEVYIANVLKCRPPENRTPSVEESNNCFPFLEQQIDMIRPEFLCLLGRVAVQAILNTPQSMAKLRGKWHRYRGIPTIVTYHPAYLLRTPAAKKDAWDDLRMLMKEMRLKVPTRSNPEVGERS
jgi:DNA polymerase